LREQLKDLAELEWTWCYIKIDDGNLISKIWYRYLVKSLMPYHYSILSTSEDTELKVFDWTQANKWSYKTIQSFVTVFRGRTANTENCKM
jgi:hypothetical protein